MSLRKARAAVASSTDAEQAAEEVLGKGNAVDAVCAAAFAAAAVSPGVLLGPVQILVGGAGAGTLAVDGRVRQPGIGAPRPRGFVEASEVPDAARVGVSWFPAALSAAIATMGSATFNQILGPAIALAKGTPRAEVLKRIASRGPRALEENPLGTELLAFCGRASQGLLTSDDLSSPRPEVQKAARIPAGERSIFTFPWANIQDELPAPPAHDVDVGRVRAAMAVDRNATYAIALWEEAPDGLFIEEIGFRAPFLAEPVRRGQTRVRPGDVRPAACPAAMLGGSMPEIAFAAFGAGDAYTVLGQALTNFNGERIEASGGARLVAITHTNGTASVLRG